MAQRLIDKTKTSNRRCCNCAFWPGYGATCSIENKAVNYWNICKKFQWNPKLEYARGGADPSDSMVYSIPKTACGAIIDCLEEFSEKLKTDINSMSGSARAHKQRIDACDALHSQLNEAFSYTAGDTVSITISKADAGILVRAFDNAEQSALGEMQAAETILRHISHTKAKRANLSADDDLLTSIDEAGSALAAASAKFIKAAKMTTRFNVAATEAGLPIQKI